MNATSCQTAVRSTTSASQRTRPLLRGSQHPPLSGPAHCCEAHNIRLLADPPTAENPAVASSLRDWDVISSARPSEKSAVRFSPSLTSSSSSSSSSAA
ncbi:unnamed protein product [Arctogadus glacialis]